MNFPEYIYEWVGTAWIRELIEERVKAGKSLVNTFTNRDGRVEISLVVIGGPHPVFVHSSCAPADKEFAINFLYELALFAPRNAAINDSKPGTAFLHKNAYTLQGKPAAVRFWHLDASEINGRNFNSFLMMELCGADMDYWIKGAGTTKQIEV